MNLSRRQLLGTLLVSGGCAAFAGLPAWALSAESPAPYTRFMRLSTLLINHQLSAAVGMRIADAALSKYAQLTDMMNRIIAIAEQRQASTVEDFFADIPEGELRELAYWVIFAWYSGVSSPAADAQLFTFEEALTFKTTADVVAIPSYGLSAPNGWSQVTVPLSPLPRF